MTKFTSATAILAAGVLSSLCASVPARADAVQDFYHNRTVTVVVATSSGGAYDVLARLLAQNLGSHIPGGPRVVVENMPGGGGIVATNWLYNVAPKDGSYIGALLNINPFEEALAASGIKYDAKKFIYLGSSDPETGFLTVSHTSPILSVEDLRTKEATVGTSGPTSSPAFFARLETRVLHAKLKIISGYPGETEAFLAMQRGELDGYPSVFYSSLTAAPQLLADDKFRLLVQFGSHTRPEFPNVPSMMKFITDPEDKLVADAAFALTDIGRPYVLPPGVPGDRTAAIKTAVRETFADPTFQAEAKRAGLSQTQPQSGSDVEKIVDRVYAMPKEVLESLAALNTPTKSKPVSR